MRSDRAVFEKNFLHDYSSDGNQRLDQRNAADNILFQSMLWFDL